MQNNTGQKIRITSVTARLIDETGQRVWQRTEEPGALIWVLNPGDRVPVIVEGYRYPASSDRPEFDIEWTPTNYNVIDLAVTGFRVQWDEDSRTWWSDGYVANDTDRTLSDVRAVVWIHGQGLGMTGAGETKVRPIMPMPPSATGYFYVTLRSLRFAYNEMHARAVAYSAYSSLRAASGG